MAAPRAHCPRGVRRLRLRGVSRSHHRADAALQALDRRLHRHRREGDVQFRRSGRGSHHAAAGGDRRHRACHDLERLAAREPAQGVVHGADVPARAAASGPLPSVSSDRCRGVRLRGSGHRCGDDPAVGAAPAPAGADAHQAADQLARHARRARGLPGAPDRLFRRARCTSSMRTADAGSTPIRCASWTARIETCRRLIAGSPALLDELDPESRAHFDALCAHLSRAGVEYHVEPRLVRGLDYYTRTVFEWTTDLLGAQSTVCAGGRYDGLVAQLGGADTPGIGWAMGQERIVMLLDRQAGDSSGAPADLFGAGGRAQRGRGAEARRASCATRAPICGCR